MYGTFWRVSSEEEHGAVNSGVEISKFSPASISGLNAAFDELVCKSPHFQCGGHGFESRTQYILGQVMVTAGSVKAQQTSSNLVYPTYLCFRSSVGLEHPAFNRGVVGSSPSGSTYFCTCGEMVSLRSPKPQFEVRVLAGVLLMLHQLNGQSSCFVNRRLLVRVRHGAQFLYPYSSMVRAFA